MMEEGFCVGCGCSCLETIECNCTQEIYACEECRESDINLVCGNCRDRTQMYEKVGKSWMLAQRNADYGIDSRRYQTNVNKARAFTPEHLAAIKSEHVRLSVEVQRAFGLRREEAMKVRVAWADRGTYLKLEGSWTKGGDASAASRSAHRRREICWGA